MSTEFIVLVAAFLFLMGWFLDFLRKEEQLLTSAYVHLTEVKWRKLPEAAIERTASVFNRILGPKWSLHSFVLIVTYSCACNCLIFSIYIKNNHPSEIDHMYFVLFLCFFGAFHDFLSLNITRFLLERKTTIVKKFLIDTIIAYCLFSSSFVFLQIAGYSGSNLMKYDPWFDSVLLNIMFEISAPIISYVYSFFNFLFLTPFLFVFYDLFVTFPHWLYFLAAAATALFPTLCYLVLLLLSALTRLLLEIAYKPVSAALDCLSRLPPHRIGLITSGLSALIILLQAWTAYKG